MRSERPDLEVPGLVEHLFRHEAGRLVANLAASLGSRNLQLAEEVVQEAMIRALKLWPFQGVPAKPAAWLYRVARNLAMDRVRRDSNFGSKEVEIRRRLDAYTPPEESGMAREITDDQLRLVFLCCHPDLSRDARVALTLRLAAGFGVDEIARAFFTPKATIAQRLVRAQKKLRQSELEIEMPPPEELPARLDAVLEALYLMFNEGYVAHQGEDLVRTDLCVEALRLTDHITGVAGLETPAGHALLALMLFQASRLEARIDGAGELVPLERQERHRWNSRAIQRAFHHLERAASGERVTAFHLEAGIASHHAAAESFDQTDWPAILDLYDELRRVAPSPIVELNRTVALSRVEGLLSAVEALGALAQEPSLTGYYLFHATRADFLVRLGETAAAQSALRRAMNCPCTEPERRFLERRLMDLGAAPEAS
ncbi:MAG: sigma-70 family RNA polymerase sigma factor [Acidobacteriota bacterium]